MTEKKKNIRLIEGSVASGLTKMTGPMVIGIFAIIAFNLADTYFVAQLGTLPLAAMSFTFPIVTIVATVALGLGTGTASVISQAIGRGEREKVRQLTTHSLILAVFTVFCLALLGLLTIEPLFRLLGADDQTMPYIVQYMTVWYLGTVFVVVPMVGNNAIRATGDSFFPAIIMVFAAAANIILDPLLIFGWWGFPKMGIRGAALATVIGRASTLLFSLSILHWREKLVDFSLPKVKSLFSSCKEILFIGLPAAATNTLNPVGQAIIIALVATYGPQAVAGFGVANRVESFALIPILALSSTMVPFIGQNFGAKKLDRVKETFQVATRSSLFWGLCCAALLNYYGKPICHLFTADEHVSRVALLYMRVVSISVGFLGCTHVVAAAFFGLNRPMAATALKAIRVIALQIPLAYLGASLRGIDGLIGGIALAFLLSGLVSLLWARLIQNAICLGHVPQKKFSA